MGPKETITLLPLHMNSGAEKESKIQKRHSPSISEHELYCPRRGFGFDGCYRVTKWRLFEAPFVFPPCLLYLFIHSFIHDYSTWTWEPMQARVQSLVLVAGLGAFPASGSQVQLHASADPWRQQGYFECSVPCHMWKLCVPDSWP